MTDPFRLEAEYYDQIWGSANRYRSEAESIDQILKEHGVHRVLDIGCGTGGHCLELAKLGYEVVGLDVSETMLTKAKHRFSGAGLKAEFVLSDMIEAHTAIQKAKITLLFDAVVGLGHSFAHLLDDKLLNDALTQISDVLKTNGIFVLCVGIAEQLRDDLMRTIKVDTLISRPELQLARLCYNYRDQTNKDTLIWNSLWLINDNGKVDFQVRTHPLRWFRYDCLRKTLKTRGLVVLHEYGDPLGRESFNRDKHDTILMVCQKS